MHFIRRGLAAASTVLLIGAVSACGDSTPTGSGATPVSSEGSFWITDCSSSGDPTEGDAAAGSAVTPDISVLDEDVPTVYVREGAAPAAELVSTEIRAGSGEQAALDDIITVEYCGVGLSSGALFDSSWARGAPATFPLSQGQLIQGWVDGIPGMQVGERRVLVIPSDLAYGDNPPPGIEPGETLVFVVELLGTAQ